MSKFSFTIEVTGAFELSKIGKDSITNVACKAAEEEMERLSQIAARNGVSASVTEVTPEDRG